MTRITRTSISFAEKLRQTAHFSHHRGVLDCSPVCVNSATFAPSGGGGGDGRAFIALKESVEEKDRSVGRLTQHPRFVRYLGTCFDPGKRQVHVLTDFIAGCNLLVRNIGTLTLLRTSIAQYHDRSVSSLLCRLYRTKEMRRNPELASMMGLTELEKIQVCVDLAEAVYFLHGHSKVFVLVIPKILRVLSIFFSPGVCPRRHRSVVGGSRRGDPPCQAGGQGGGRQDGGDCQEENEPALSGPRVEQVRVMHHN